jgi:putative endonuclease
LGKAALGSFGEQVAEAYLRRQQAVILARNWRCRHGEIDLVARLGGQLLFVEVRTRRQAPGAAPEESLGPLKRQRMERAAYAYLEAANLAEETPWRIDLIVVEVSIGGRVVRLEQIESAVGEGGAAG